MSKILILDDDNDRISWFLNNVYPHRVFVCYTAVEAITALKRDRYDVIFLDHDLSPEHYEGLFSCRTEQEYLQLCEKFDLTSGMAVAKYINRNKLSPQAKVVIHTHNGVGAKRMAQELQGYNVQLMQFDTLKRKGLLIKKLCA